MESYLIRHGIAADTSPDGSDHARALTAEGIAALRAEARGLRLLKVRFDLLLTSPLVRARQTAEVLSAELEGKPPVVIVAALSTAGSPPAVTTELRNLQSSGHSGGSGDSGGSGGSAQGHRRVALVGHEPGMGELAAAWIGARAPLSFEKGAICRIDFQQAIAAAEGELRWFVTPRMLISLGHS